jgi:hypothetical protein
MSYIISKSVNSGVRLPIKSKLSMIIFQITIFTFFDFTLDKFLSNNHYIKEHQL